MGAIQNEYTSKNSVIKAIQLDTEATLRTVNGKVKGSIGDYLCTNNNGQQFIIKKDAFEREYVAVDVKEKKPLKLSTYKDIAKAYQQGYLQQTEEDMWNIPDSNKGGGWSSSVTYLNSTESELWK